MIRNIWAGRLPENGLACLHLVLLIVVLPVCPALAQEAGAIISLLGAAEVLREGRWQPVWFRRGLQNPRRMPRMQLASLIML